MEAQAHNRQESIRRHRLSYEDYLVLPAEGHIIEWADGEVIYHMPPTLPHQDIATLLTTLFRAYARILDLGRVIAAPFEVRLWPDGPSREPDILFIGRDKLPLLGNKRFNGAPDLVVEIISPTSVTLDRVEKFLEYEHAGVGEYWIVDPRRQQQQADFFVRNENDRFASAPVDDDGVYASTVLPGFRLNVPWLWQPERVSTERALAKMLAGAPGLSAELRDLYRRMLELLPDDEI